MVHIYEAHICCKNNWIILFFSSFLLVLVSCHGTKEFGTQEDYSRYTEIHPPYKPEVLRALEIASVEILKLDDDTSGLGIIVMESDTTYLIAYGPPPGVDTVFTDTSFYFIVHAGGHGDVVISKRDFRVLKLYRAY